MYLYVKCLYVFMFILFTQTIHTNTHSWFLFFNIKGSLLFCNLLFPFNNTSYKSLQISHRHCLHSFWQLYNNGTLLYGCMNMFNLYLALISFPVFLLLKVMPQWVKLYIFFTLLKLSLQGRFLEVGLLGKM